MRSAGEIVHLGGGGGSAHGALLHETVYFVGTAHRPLGEPLDEDALLAVLAHLQTRPVDLQQVADHLVVDLQVRRAHHERGVLRRLLLDEAEDLLHRSRHDPALRVARRVLEALHRVGLARARLPVRQYCRVVAF